MKEKIDSFLRLFVLCTIGAIGEALFFLFIILGRIKIQSDWNKIKLMPPKEGFIVVYNHPSLWEPGVLPFLFILHFLFSFSFRFIPYSTPDKRNFFDKWWFWPIRLFCIPIDREKGRTKGLRDLIRYVKEGKIVLVAPEGGRTDKGEEFKILKDGNIIIRKGGELSLEEKNLPKIRRFQRGFTALLNLTDAVVVPIWVEGGDKVIPNKSYFPKGPYFLLPNLKAKTIIKIGERVKTKHVNELEDILLKLSQKGISAH